jgi:hypothetical protein
MTFLLRGSQSQAGRINSTLQSGKQYAYKLCTALQFKQSQIVIFLWTNRIILAKIEQSQYNNKLLEGVKYFQVHVYDILEKSHKNKL